MCVCVCVCVCVYILYAPYVHLGVYEVLCTHLLCSCLCQVCDSLDMKYKAKTWEILALMYATAVPVVPHRGSAAALSELLVPGAVVGQSRRSSTHSAQDQVRGAKVRER